MHKTMICYIALTSKCWLIHTNHNLSYEDGNKYSDLIGQTKKYTWGCNYVKSACTSCTASMKSLIILVIGSIDCWINCIIHNYYKLMCGQTWLWFRKLYCKEVNQVEKLINVGSPLRNTRNHLRAILVNNIARYPLQWQTKYSQWKYYHNIMLDDKNINY